MKPLALTVSAFGPFAEEEEVNFEALGGDPLFLIHGSTGSGKSALLDAIGIAILARAAAAFALVSTSCAARAPSF